MRAHESGRAHRAAARPTQVDVLPLAEAKLAAPRPKSGMLDRPRILRALDAGEEAALTLLAAPVGYGKTTAVSAWASSRDAALAWVTLDALDNDPVRLWTYVATAVDRVREGLGRGALQRLAQAPPIEAPIDELMNGIAAFEGKLVIVLDDLQTVTETETLATIDYALDRLPPNARVLVLTRTDPALALGQLRARGGLAELRADDLAFTTGEARELLVKRGGLELQTDDVERLHERTEGWPAALFLATLWLRRVDKPDLAVREFGGDHRFVTDYLTQEVIDSLDDDGRAFVLRASVLGKFTADLCDAVFDRSDSAATLAEVERANLFVVRLAHGGWYRVHPLFAEFAGFQLASLEPGAATDIHRRAAVWLRERGLVVEAAEHAAAAGDYELVAELLVEYHLPLIRTGRVGTFLRWVRTLPDEQVVGHPELAVASAVATTMVGQSALERRRFLELARRSEAEHPERSSPYVRAVQEMVRAASVDGNVAEAVLAGRRAVDAARLDGDDALVAALGGHARALYFAGELEDAWKAALQAVEHPAADERAPGHAFARSTLALIAVDRGRLGSARAHAETAKSLVSGVGSARSWLGANASVAVGCVLAAEGNLAEAERELAYAQHFFADEVASVHHAWLLVVLARVRCRRGRLDDAAATLRFAREEIDDLADAGRIPSLAGDVERELVEARLRAGNGEVLEWPSEAQLEVLRLLASDLSSREIGAELFISPNTVRSHTRAIYRKLRVNSRVDAVARAEVLGLLGDTQSPR